MAALRGFRAQSGPGRHRGQPGQGEHRAAHQRMVSAVPHAQLRGLRLGQLSLTEHAQSAARRCDNKNNNINEMLNTNMES